MAGLFNRIKRWTGLDVIQSIDLNAEFDNIINNLGPAGMSGWSASVAQMQIQTSPGTFGAESLATSLNGEIERLRYQLNAIIGGPDNVWYDPPAVSLSEIDTSLPTPPPVNRIVSGALISGTNQPGHLVAAGGSTRTITLKCGVTPFKAYINGQLYTFNNDITSGTLSLAPSTGNTFAINDSNADGSAKTQGFGTYIADLSANLADGTQRFMSDYSIYGNTVGASITGIGGTFQAFSYTHSAVTEYFMGYIKPTVTSSLIEVNNCQRGFFFNSSNAQVPAIGLHNSDNVILMNLIWIYVTTGGALLAVYTHPRYSPTQPTSSASGDMWYDTVNQTWKQSNGSTYAIANAILVGVCLTNTSGCVAARSFDSYAAYSSSSNVVPEYYSSTEYRTKYDNNQINVYGNNLAFDKDELRWNTSDLVSGLTLSASNSYFLYLDQTGVAWIDVIQPNKRSDLGGFYHPAQTWRCIGSFLYNASGFFDTVAYATMGGTLGEFIPDKSISIKKMKASPLILYDANATSPVVAMHDQISHSTVAVLSGGTQTSATQIIDTNSAALTASLWCSGRTLLVGLEGDGTNVGDIQVQAAGTTTSFSATIKYYLNGVSNRSVYFSVAGASSSALGVFFPPGSSWVLMHGVPAGLNVITVYYLVAGTNPSLTLNNIRLFAKEI
jgi:hypothetical protein